MTTREISVYLLIGAANLSLWHPFEIAGSWEAILTLHDVTAEPCRASPPKAVVYQSLIKMLLP